MKLRPYSSTILGVYSLILIGIGLYFILLRPPFLAEDAKYVGSTLQEIQIVAPDMTQWLGLVFTVFGGFITASGIMTLYIANTSFRNRSKGAGMVVAIAGLSSIVLMAIINVFLNSDFKLPLVGVALLWGAALVFYLRGK